MGGMQWIERFTAEDAMGAKGRKRRVKHAAPGWTRRWTECKGSRLGLDLGVRVMYHVVTVLAVRSDQ